MVAGPAGLLALGLLDTEPIRGEQQLPDTGEKRTQRLDRSIPDLPGGIGQSHHVPPPYRAGARGRTDAADFRAHALTRHRAA